MQTFCHWWWHGAAGSVSAGARHQCGGNLTKPMEMSTTWQDESLAGLPPWQGLFFSHLTARTPWILLVVGSFFRNFVSQDSSYSIFPAQLSPSGMVHNQLLQPGCSSPGCSAAGREMRMLQVLDRSYIWIFTSITEHLCIFSMLNDKAIWRLTPRTLPER